MGRRILAFVCAAVLAAAMVGGASAMPLGVERRMLPLAYHAGIYPERQRPAPLVSAMFLILAGIGISMLFDKHDRGE